MGSVDTSVPPPKVETSTSSYVVNEHPLGKPDLLKVICIGAGATGLEVAYKLQKHLRNVDFQIYEKNEALGGTWLEKQAS
ncbi:uncharacterized protein Z519_05390 [Cladophialophora bantiana CBS 173.52]|uniref:Flavin-containing monooxygenase n=1 Tax=Cladophialophora bantiana (strain ATCC 10958 / CBS 173.52 / CDC B-1940 / NIH 8579) TaxID=1442370 RepID=A0A0D2IB82_CLAB1|nr:uncharacterized protein Z519_05390 [Cladophialophora bantiana CBS 173.52]KIW94074.1 hypothetical protein Z519_05390 [Cladophialophora bantiana CBS 173.52]